MATIDINTAPDEQIADVLDSVVSVEGVIKKADNSGATPRPHETAEMLGVLRGVTFLSRQVIVYMDNGQTTTFLRDDPISVIVVKS